MRKIIILVITLTSLISISAETIASRYFGAEINLNNKNNACAGNTDGGVEVIVVTNVISVQNALNS